MRRSVTTGMTEGEPNMAGKTSKKAEALEASVAIETRVSESKLPETVPTAPAASESHQAEASSPPEQRAIRDPFPIKTVDLGGYKLRLQHSRKNNQIQIKFGEGKSEDRPPTEIRDF